MALTPGTRLGPYEIAAQIGVGGMGEVYEATDTNLKRRVAIKVLPASVAGDADRLARFQREAEVLAALNDPNIAAIYGLERSGDLTALVMELVEGDDLARRITRGPISVDEALAIARQIAGALEAAHKAGIVHRDLKPANVKVRPDGTVKVLDFGIAKATASGSQDPVSAPTLTSPAVTGLGIVLGTATYMSPEQTRGAAVDHRADVWSFGCVLYEMLTGRRAFDGETIQDTVARVLEREPDWKALPARTPAPIRRVLQGCLQKDPERRLQRIEAARVELGKARSSTPVRHRLIASLIAVVIVTALAIAVIGWWFVGREIRSAAHEPVSVLIADFENRTGDATFDRALEPMLRLALEGAGFINAYDRNRFRATFGAKLPEKLDEAAARQAAMREAVAIVLSGTITRAGSAYEISVKGAKPISGNVTFAAKAQAANKDGVLASVARVAASVRKALGENAAEANQLFAMRSISAGSLEAVAEYAAGIELQSKGVYEEAIRRFRKAVAIDPNFGAAYNSLSVNLKNVGSIEESEKYAKEALRHLDAMTERERFATRANYYRLTGDLQQCIKEYGELIARYPADPVARNNRALCFGRLRDYRGAIEETRQALKILPNHMTYRANLALFADYAGDFAAAEQEIRSLTQPSAGALQALPLSLMGQGRLTEAAESYRTMSTMGPFGASFAAAGLGDLAVYEGRFADGAAIFATAAADALKTGRPDQAAMKFAELAYARLSTGERAAAIAAADAALANSKALSIRFLSARILVEAGALAKAEPIAAGLAAELATEPQVYGKIVAGEIAFKRHETSTAIKMLTDANSIVDTWIGHFDLGRMYLEARAYAQADSEFERCIRRRGEALLLVDEDPTYSYFPPVYYYLGLAREGLGSAGFASVYREYLTIRGTSPDDPLVPEIRQRTAAR